MSDGLPQRGTAQRRQRRQHLTGHPDIVSSAGTKRAAELRHELQSPDTAAQHSQGSVNIIQHRSAAEPGQNYEYLDHPADVQLHAWGSTLQEAFEGAALAMYNYMTPLSGVSVDPKLTRNFRAEGHDMQSLLFSFLDELLFVFLTELLVCKHVTISTFDQAGWVILAEGQGEHFDRERHAIGTEVKAITYSAMQIREESDDAEVFVIVDI